MSIKLASYTNKKGVVIEVTKSHLDTAIKIYEELRKSSTSQRISWSKHKKMMEKENHYNSENSENYRQLVKKERKRRGVLPDVVKHAELIADDKLKSIKEEIGEISYAKRDAQNSFRELNRLKRELTDDVLFFDEILKGVKNTSFDKTFEKLEPLKTTGAEMVVNMSDWHIGLKTDEFNYEVAMNRIDEYSKKIMKYCKRFGVSTVNVAGLGDMVNGQYMRPSQIAENEFNFSEQIVKATEIVFVFLQKLSTELNVVYLGSIIGNHSRMASGHKNNTTDGDNAENIIDSVIKSYINISGNKRLSISDKKDSVYSLSFDIQGVRFKAVHGDLINKSSKEKLQKFISADEKFYDILLYGHFHHTSIVEENHGRLAIGLGCLQGTTEYSSQLGYETYPSQTIIIIEDGEVIPVRISLGGE